MKGMLRAQLGVVLSVVASSSVFAAATTNWFIGEVNSINDPTAAPGGVKLGTKVGGYFTFDDSPAASLGNSRYRATIALYLPTMTLAIESDSNFIRARNNAEHSPEGNVDYFEHCYDSFGPIPGTDPYHVAELAVYFVDTTRSIFTSDPSLPYRPRVCDFDQRTWILTGQKLTTGQNFTVRGHIVLTFDSTNCPAISGLSLSPCMEVQDAFQMRLSWDAVAGISASNFLVERADTPVGPWALVPATRYMANNRLFVILLKGESPCFFRIALRVP